MGEQRDRTTPRRRARLFEAPERGSADELLDAGAHDELDAMRHSAAHVMAEAVLDLFPGTKLGIGPAINDGFYYDFQLPAPLTPDDLEEIEARMAATVTADHPFVRRELPPEEGRAFFAERDQPFKVEILDDLAAKAARRRHADAADERLRARPVHRPVQGPARRVHGQDRAVQAAGGLRRLLARRPEAARAPADLRHGLADAGGARPATSGGARRPRSATTAGWASSSTCSASTTSRPGAAFWHPKGRRLYQTLEGAMREIQARRGYQEVYTPPLVHQQLWQQSGHWDHYRDNMFLVEADGQTVQPQADELPRVHVHLPLAGCARIATCRCGSRSTAGSTATSCRAAQSGLTRVRHFVQDDGHIYVRPDQIQDEIQALMGEVREAYGWFGLEPRYTFGTRPDKALGDPALWHETEAMMQARARGGRRAATG